MNYKKIVFSFVLTFLVIFSVPVYAENNDISQNFKISELNIYYINDTHGDVIKFGKLVTELNKIKKSENPETTLVSTQGDMYIGKNQKRNLAMTKLMNIADIELFTLGNHEFDGNSDLLANQLKKGKFVTVITNMDIPKENGLHQLELKNKLFKSYIMIKNGDRYGIIGAAPIGVNVGLVDKNHQVTVFDTEKTINELNKAVQNLENKGVNKIILVSHLGYFGEGGDLNIAKNTEGIDVILGGHTHLKIDGIQSVDVDKTHLKNIVLSKRNEPVVIVQTNGGANDIGNLVVPFDEKGIILINNADNLISNEHINVNQNTVMDKKVKKIVKKVLGKNYVVAKIKTPFVSSGTWEERNTENPVANLLCDAVFEAARGKNPDVVLVHSPTVRGGLEGDLTAYHVKYTMLPFNGEMFYAELIEKDFIDLLNREALTSITTDNSQIIQVHGMKYVVDKTVKNPYDKNTICVRDVILLDKNNNFKKKINVDNPSDTATVRCIVPGYLFIDKRTKPILERAANVKLVGNEHSLLLKYLKKHNEINAVREGRVKVIEK